MKEKKYIKIFLFLVIGMSIVLSFFLLTGANTSDPIGRYQLQAVMRGNFPELFVIDTATGRVKWVDSKDENKPFEQIRSN